MAKEFYIPREILSHIISYYPCRYLKTPHYRAYMEDNIVTNYVIDNEYIIEEDRMRMIVANELIQPSQYLTINLLSNVIDEYGSKSRRACYNNSLMDYIKVWKSMY
jgi:hypothetical protein|tara:strand:- start:2150 stop:2467 length:318 start_codon:yes stop_codon:yes gene_type:complete